MAQYKVTRVYQAIEEVVVEANSQAEAMAKADEEFPPRYIESRLNLLRIEAKKI
jgi:hypothetical protein